MTCYYPPLGSGVSSAWNFFACVRFSDVISRENQWRRREMSAVFSGYTSPFVINRDLKKALQNVQLKSNDEEKNNNNKK